MLPIDWTFWCYKCGGMISMRTCPHGKEDRLFLSGTALRKGLSEGGEIPAEFSRPEVLAILKEYYAGIDAADRVDQLMPTMPVPADVAAGGVVGRLADDRGPGALHRAKRLRARAGGRGGGRVRFGQIGAGRGSFVPFAKNHGLPAQDGQ